MIIANLKSGNKGFTMVEAAVVLAMAAVLTAVTVPMITSSLHSMQLVSDARNIATSLTYAKLGATSQFTRFRLTFDMADNEWQMERLNRTTGQYELQQGNNQLSSGVSGGGIGFKTNSTTAPDIFPTASSAVITFDPRGIPEEGLSVVYLSDDRDDYAVSVSLSGKVQIWRIGDASWEAL